MSATQSALQGAKTLLFDLMRFEMQLPTFLEFKGKQIVDEEILFSIKRKMRTAGYSQKIIDGTSITNFFVDDSGFIQFDVESELDAENGYDIAKGREEGTSDHDVRPKDPKGSLRWVLKTGEVIYRKFARPKGITATHIIRDTTKQKLPIVQQRLTQISIEFFRSTVR